MKSLKLTPESGDSLNSKSIKIENQMINECVKTHLRIKKSFKNHETV